MASNVVMPKTGADATEAKLIRWLKNEGEKVSRGDMVAEIETEKVNMEVEAYSEGVLHILVPEGTTLDIGATIAQLLKEGEAAAPASSQMAPVPAASAVGDPPAARPAGDAPPDFPAQQTPGPAAAATLAEQSSTQVAAQPPTAEMVAGSTVASASADSGTNGRVKASPLARRLAQEHQLDLARISGRGPGGRVVREDVEAAIQYAATASSSTSAGSAPAALAATAAPAAAPAPMASPAPVAAVPPPVPAPVSAPAPTSKAASAPVGVTIKDLSRIQITTGRRLSESKQAAPHFYLTVEVDMGEALALRSTLNTQAAGSVKISVNDLVIKAAVWALGRHPNLNSSFRDGKLWVFDHVNIAIAVALEEGLSSPVIPDADRKSLGQIARESRAMIERARNGKMRPEDLSEGTFTVSNLGMYDMDNFIAIINPPQAAILAVGAVRQVPVVRGGQIVIGQVMKASVSVDHRAADGAQGAQFLSDVRRALETPLLMAL